MTIPRLIASGLMGAVVFAGCAKKKAKESDGDMSRRKPPTQNAQKSDYGRKSELAKKSGNKTTQKKESILPKFRSIPPSPGIRSSRGGFPELRLPIAQPTSFGHLSMDRLTRNALANATLGHVNDALRNALAKAGLNESSQYFVPNGFAIVTPIEQIDAKGKPLGERFRFSLDAKPHDRLWDRLTLPKSGRWRLFVLVVTDRDLKVSGKPLTRKAGDALRRGGSKDGLPVAIRENSVTPAHECTVLVYEFLQQGKSETARPQTSSEIAAAVHLKPLRDALKP